MERDVVVLEDGNFDENVFKSKDSWFVEFYAPWCGHCKKLEPEWFKVASSLNGVVKVAKVDSTVHTRSAQRFGISGYPTIKFFPAGSTRDSDMVDYGGARDAASLTSWAKEQAEKYKPLEINQLVSQSVYEESCVQFNGVCVVVFFPHIFDSSKQERDGYLTIIKNAATNLKGKPLSYLWSQGGDNYEFEEAF
jgi:protein disulfide-isomerase A6